MDKTTGLSEEFRDLMFWCWKFEPESSAQSKQCQFKDPERTPSQLS